MPRLARPSARSRNGLLGPMVSSRSFGPEPCTSTTAGQGPSPTGVVSVPGRSRSPTVTSRDETSPAYGGCSHASVTGWKNSPAMRCSASKTTRMFNAECSNWAVTTTAS